MQQADEQVIEALEGLRLIHLEAQLVDALAERTSMDGTSALDAWYRSDLCPHVERNELGLQFIDAAYLVEELMERESM